MAGELAPELAEFIPPTLLLVPYRATITHVPPWGPGSSCPTGTASFRIFRRDDTQKITTSASIISAVAGNYNNNNIFSVTLDDYKVRSAASTIKVSLIVRAHNVKSITRFRVYEHSPEFIRWLVLDLFNEWSAYYEPVSVPIDARPPRHERR